MGKTRGQLVGVVILVVALALGAGPSAWAAEKVTVGIGGVGLMVYLPTVLAKTKGYFADEGLDVEILDIKGGGSQAASALIGGSVDFSANAIDHAIKAKAQGKDLLAVHSHVRLAPMGLVVANKYKGEIKSIADLKGRPLGVTSPGSQTHMVLGYLLAKNGVKADEVKIIGAGGNTMPLAIEKDTVHAGVLVDPFFTVFLKQGKGYALVDMFTTKGTIEAMGGEVQGTTLLTRPDVVAKRPATVQKMVNALVRANKFIVGSSGAELASDAPQGDQWRPRALRRVVRALARGLPAGFPRHARRRRPRHRDHAGLRRRSGRNEAGAGEPVRQQVRAEGPGAVARRPAALRTWTGSRFSRGRRTRR